MVRLDNPVVRRTALALLASRLEAGQVARALRALDTHPTGPEQAWFLNELASMADPADERQSQLTGWALDALTAIRSGADFGLVASLAAARSDGYAPDDGAAVSEERRPAAALIPVDKVLPALRSMDYNNRLDALGALARATSGPLPPPLVSVALTLPVVDRQAPHSPRGDAITGLAHRFTNEELAVALRAALELPSRIGTGDSQAWGWNWTREYPRGAALLALAPRLRGELAEAAFVASKALPWVAREEVQQEIAKHRRASG